jgi:hypothetical protein
VLVGAAADTCCRNADVSKVLERHTTRIEGPWCTGTGEQPVLAGWLTPLQGWQLHADIDAVTEWLAVRMGKWLHQLQTCHIREPIQRLNVAIPACTGAALPIAQVTDSHRELHRVGVLVGSHTSVRCSSEPCSPKAHGATVFDLFSSSHPISTCPGHFQTECSWLRGCQTC